MTRFPLLVLAGVCAVAVSCATPGVRRPGVPGSELERVWGAIRLEAEYNRTDREPQGKTDRTLLREEIETNIRGRVYDSRFLRYQANLTLRFLQDDSSGGGGFSSLWFPRYSARLRFLPQHPTPFTLYGRRDENRSLIETQSTASIVETKEDELGALLGFRRGKLSGEAEVRRTTLDTSGLTTDRKQTNELFHIFFHHRPRPEVSTSGRYAFETYDEATSGQDYETHTATLQNTLRSEDRIEGRSRFSLYSSVFLRDREGTTEFMDLRALEDLRVRWTAALDSQTRYDFQEYEAVSDTRRHTVFHEFEYRLYQSLVATLSANASESSLTEGSIEQRGWNAGVDYRKETPIGLVTAGYHHGFRREENNLVTNTLQALNEFHVLAATEVAVLEQDDVDRATIVVTDATGAVTYTEGLDYTVIARGRLTEVVRIPGGLIADGQRVRVDYEYAVPSQAVFDTKSDRYRASILLFRSLRLRAELQRIRQRTVSGDADRALEDVDSLVLGASFDRGPFRIEGTYTDHDSSTAPYEQFRFEAAYTRSLGPRAQAGVAVTDVRTDFPDQPRLRTTTVAGRFRSRPNRQWSIQIEPGYRIERGRGFDRDVFELNADVRYFFGKFSVHWTLRHESLDIEGGDTDQTLTKITLERRW